VNTHRKCIKVCVPHTYKYAHSTCRRDLFQQPGGLPRPLRMHSLLYATPRHLDKGPVSQRVTGCHQHRRYPPQNRCPTRILTTNRCPTRL
jgi:hypothetical protein